jgi:carbamoyl-phosphate synthase small subunit
MCYTPSNWQSEGTFPDFLDAQGVVAIEGIDTRALTLKIRGSGAMRAAISTVDLNPQSLVARVCQSPQISDHNFVADVSPKQERIVRPGGWACGRRVVTYDCGMKAGIEEELLRVGCEVVVVPFDTPAARTLALEPDGVFFSNGPGDPTQVVSTAHAVKDLLGKVPIFGICLGHQLMALAMGGSTYKLKFGHRGANHPVKDLRTGRVYITSQNHGYAVDESSIPEDIAVPAFRNLNDGTNEGFLYKGRNILTVQFHPEASPGPCDSGFLFDEFAEMMSRK